MTIIFLIAGAFFLYIGAESLVRGCSLVALRLGLPPLVVGLVIAGFGTSLPELVVSLGAALQGRGDLAIGNAVGSNICNLGLILALSALVRPLNVRSRIVSHELPVMIAVTVASSLLLYDGELSRWKSLLMLASLAFYVSWIVIEAKNHEEEADEKEFANELPSITGSYWQDALFSTVGLAALWIGGELFVKGAVILAIALGVSDAVIGLTVVAFGTSLPELAISLVAVVRSHRDIAIGNIIGSNIFNLLAIIGAAGALAPFTIQNINRLDYAVMLVYSFAAWLVVRKGHRMGRGAGLVFLTGYVFFITYQFFL